METRDGTSGCAALFEPIAIGPLRSRNRVTFITPHERIAQRAPEESRDGLIARLRAGGVRLHAGSALQRDGDGLFATAAWDGARQALDGFDGIVVRHSKIQP